MESTTGIWHKRLSHYHHYGLLLMQRKHMAKDLHVLDENPPICHLDENPPICQACHYGKQSRLSLPKAT